MNWEMLTAIAQSATVLVGIASPIYFAVQLREQTRERRREAMNALTVQRGDLKKALHENAEFAALFSSHRAVVSRSRSRLKARVQRVPKSVLQELGRDVSPSKRRNTQPRVMDQIDRTMSDFLAYGGVRQWWERHRHWHTEALARVVDAIIARGEQPTAYSTYNLQDVIVPKAS